MRSSKSSARIDLRPRQASLAWRSTPLAGGVSAAASGRCADHRPENLTVGYRGEVRLMDRKSVACPTCGVAPGQKCRGLSGAVIAYTHKSRARAEAAKDKKRPPAAERGQDG